MVLAGSVPAPTGSVDATEDAPAVVDDAACGASLLAEAGVRSALQPHPMASSVVSAMRASFMVRPWMRNTTFVGRT